MTIEVLFFGATADVVGTRRKQIETQDGVVGDLLHQLITDHPDLERHKLLFSVNQEYVPTASEIRDGDEIGIFTAVSGG